MLFESLAWLSLSRDELILCATCVFKCTSNQLRRLCKYASGNPDMRYVNY